MAEPQTKPDPLEQFRESLKDLAVVCERLSENCESTKELVGMLNLAIENDGQLRWLMSLVTRRKF